MGSSWTITDAPLPSSLDAPDAWAYRGIAAIGRADEVARTGNADLALDARAIRTGMLHQEYNRKVRLVAVTVPDGVTVPGEPGRLVAQDVVGHAFVSLPLNANAHLARVHVVVRPDRRGHGIGSALYERALAEVARAGRTTVLADVQVPEPAPGDRTLTPRTGTGTFPAEAPGVGFALARGFEPEQVERRSVLDLPVEPSLLARHLDEATAAAGDDYRLHLWEDQVPEEWLDGFALLETRMSTDAPSGGLDVQEDVVDADRVRTMDATHRENGDGYLVAAVEHLPTGTLAGHSMLLYSKEPEPAVFQEDTIVLREHRGHRLGMLLKASNLVALAERRPHSERVHTFNAEENAHMLAINVALGFRPSGASVALQKRLG